MKLLCFGFFGGEWLWTVYCGWHLNATHPNTVCLVVLCFKEWCVHVCVADRLELLAKLLVEVRGLLQSGLQGGDLLLFNLQRWFQSWLQFGFKELKSETYSSEIHVCLCVSARMWLCICNSKNGVIFHHHSHSIVRGTDFLARVQQFEETLVQKISQRMVQQTLF